MHEVQYGADPPVYISVTTEIFASMEKKRSFFLCHFPSKLKQWHWRFLCNSTTPSQLFHVPTFITGPELNPLNSCVLLLHGLILPVAVENLLKTHLGMEILCFYQIILSFPFFSLEMDTRRAECERNFVWGWGCICRLIIFIS